MRLLTWRRDTPRWFAISSALSQRREAGFGPDALEVSFGLLTARSLKAMEPFDGSGGKRRKAAESGLPEMAENGSKPLWLSMKPPVGSAGQRGRPPKKRLDQADAAYLKSRILEAHKSLALFYKEAFEDAGDPKYQGYNQPADVGTVDRAFDDAFSGRRSLPPLYWEVLSDQLGITEGDLPSASTHTAGAVEAGGAGPTPPVSVAKEATVNYRASGAESCLCCVSPPLVPNNLPRRDQTVVGRDPEIEKVLRVLTRSARAWLVSITGVGGVGKSALALEVAHRCLRRIGLPEDIAPEELAFDAFVWTSAKRTELDGPVVRPRFVVTPNLPTILHEILKVVAPEKTGALPPEHLQRKLVLDLLRAHRTLLIVDNLETVDDEQVLAFLKDIPEPSKVIVTDRRAVHESRSLPLMELSPADAKRLIQEQCQSELLRDRVLLTAGQIDELARNTGGIPLAIIWALGRIASGCTDPGTVLRRLADAGSSPVLGFLFDESHGAIRETSRRLLGALALPGTPVRGDVLGAWLQVGQNETEDALEELQQFALISECRQQTKGDRAVEPVVPTFRRFYRLLPLTREYVLRRGVKPDSELRERIYRWLLDSVRVRDGNPDWPPISTINRIEESRDLLAWCVQDAHDRQRHEVVIEMVRRIGHALGIRGYNDLRFRLAELGVDSARVLGIPTEIARVLVTNKAWVQFVWADHRGCAESLAAAEVPLAQGGDPVLQAIAQRLRAQVAKERGEMQQAEPLLEDALTRFKALSDPYQLAITHGTWGSLQRDMGRLAASESGMREALRLTTGLPNAEELRSVMCQKLTGLLIGQDRLEEAEELNGQAEELLTHLRRQMGVAYCRRNEALIAEKRGDIPKALEYARQAESLFALSKAGQEIAGVLKRLQEKVSGLPLQAKQGTDCDNSLKPNRHRESR